MQSIIFFVVLSLIMTIFLTNFIVLTDKKDAQDFNFKEYIHNFSIKRIDLKYVIIFFILFIIITRNSSYIDTISFAFVSFALVLALIMDIKYMIIPDTCSILVLISGIINILTDFSKEKIITSICGLLIGGLTLFVIDYIFEKITKKEGFGYGDMKLLASIGLLLGYKDIIVVMILSVIISAIFSIIYLIVNKIKHIKDVYIAFGPFIVISSFIVMVIPSTVIISWYNYLMDVLVNKMI